MTACPAHGAGGEGPGVVEDSHRGGAGVFVQVQGTEAETHSVGGGEADCVEAVRGGGVGVDVVSNASENAREGGGCGIAPALVDGCIGEGEASPLHAGARPEEDSGVGRSLEVAGGQKSRPTVIQFEIETKINLHRGNNLNFIIEL